MNQKNLLFLVADDLNYNSVGAFGCPVEDITPNLDRLALKGMCLERAHVTAAICMPSRECMLTGKYPHNNGAPGFDPISPDVKTLGEVLRENGYLNGICGKEKHCAPAEKFAWDYMGDVFNAEHLYGRTPYIYYKKAKEFFDMAKEQGKPFFYMANSHDPHRPFAGSEQELKKYGFQTYASRYYKPEEVAVPGFLPDIEKVRQEAAEYFTSVHRCDETMGMVWKALQESGMEENTVIVFLSDNGMAFPFAKTNCYLNSNRTPMIVCAPGETEAGSRDGKHFVSGIDFMPTMLDLLEIETSEPMDGRSYRGILQGKEEDGWTDVYTQITSTARHDYYPMRGIQDENYGYMFNDWSDGETLFWNESKMGRTYQAMKEAAAHDEEIAKRVQLYDYRVVEELYDLKHDPDALVNLIDDPEYEGVKQAYRERMKQYMESTDDPILEKYLEAIKKTTV